MFLCFLLQCLNEGDIVIGKVAFKRPFGITVTLTMLEFGCKRDFTDLDIQVYILYIQVLYYSSSVEPVFSSQPILSSHPIILCGQPFKRGLIFDKLRLLLVISSFLTFKMIYTPC